MKSITALCSSAEQHNAETEIVVAIAGSIVVAISHAAVLRIVVPTAATIHAVRPRRPDAFVSHGAYNVYCMRA